MAASRVLAGGGFLGGYVVGYAQHKTVADKAITTVRATTQAPDAGSTPSPLSTPTPGISATLNDRISNARLRTGAYQRTWALVAGASATVAPSSSVVSYTFRFSRAPACRGVLRIFPETLQGGTNVYRMIPDAP